MGGVFGLPVGCRMVHQLGRFAWLALSATLMLLAACAGSLEHLERENGTAAGSKAGLPAPGTLDSLRGGAGLKETLIYGNECLAHSIGLSESGSALLLDASDTGPGGGGEMAWAIYRCSPGQDELDTLRLLLAVPLESECWVALADFSAGCWVNQGPFNGSTTLLASARDADGEPKYLSPGRFLYCAAIVPPGKKATVEALSLRTLKTNNAPPSAVLSADKIFGYTPLSISLDASQSKDPDGLIVKYEWDCNDDGIYESATSFPYHDFQLSSEYFGPIRVRVTDDNQDTDVQHVMVRAIAPPVAAISPQSACGQAPFLVQFDGSGCSGYYISWDWNADGTFDAYGSSPVASFSEPGSYKVTCVSTDFYGGTAVAYAQVNVSSVYMALQTAGSTGWYSSLATIGGYPAAAYIDYTVDKLFFIKALDSAGSAWDQPVEVHAGFADYKEVSLHEVAGTPAIAFGGRGTWYVRASDAAGTAWPAPVDLLGEPNAVDLAVLNGKPAVLMGGPDGFEFRMAQDAIGSAWRDRQDIAAFTGVTTVSLDSLAGMPCMSWSAEGDVRFAKALDIDALAWGPSVSVRRWPSNAAYGSDMAIVGGFPAIAYEESFGGGLMYTRALDQEGSSWGAPLSLDKDADYTVSMAVVGGKPCVAFYDRHARELQYKSAADTTGFTWLPAQTVDCGSVFEFTSLLDLAGRPAIAYHDYQSFDLRYVLTN